MKSNKVTIIGAGLCGTLLSIRMAQRGYQVDLHEKRPDMRNEDLIAGRSINLALSARGINALKLCNVYDDVKDLCIPMLGRMIHPLGGDSFFSRYSGRQDEFINSISRSGLNIALLDAAEKLENINLHFESACTHVDLETATAKFKSPQGETTVTSDVVIGTDGAGSIVRKSMMAKTTSLLFNYSQNFLRHGYKELSIHPTETGDYRIDKNALHIWPRGEFMIIALPNLDGSFTVTMFHPFEGKYGFNQLDSDAKINDFFETQFPELIPHLPHYLEDYHENPVATLGTIKCYPWQAYGKACIMGDAAHAIVPFYGQGMNASFEDVTVFDQALDRHEGDWSAVLEAFQENRVQDANAIADLALDNFYEMVDHVDNPDFVAKRKLEIQLEQTYDDYYSKYSLVTFKPELSYHEAMVKGRKQDEFLLELCQQERVPNLEEVYEMIKGL